MYLLDHSLISCFENTMCCKSFLFKSQRINQNRPITWHYDLLIHSFMAISPTDGSLMGFQLANKAASYQQTSKPTNKPAIKTLPATCF